jgi:hypothetical protein
MNTENIIAPVYGGMLLGLVVSYFMVNRKRVGLYFAFKWQTMLWAITETFATYAICAIFMFFVTSQLSSYSDL